MPKHVITRYEVDELVQARKIAGKTRSLAKGDRPLVIDIRRADTPFADLTLTFQSEPRDIGLPGIPSSSRPKASLFWHGSRIRGIDWTIKHEVLRKGVPTGEVIRGWHEHYWEDGEEFPPIREPQNPPRNNDAASLIQWACKRWNIDGVPTAMELFDE